MPSEKMKTTEGIASEMSKWLFALVVALSQGEV